MTAPSHRRVGTAARLSGFLGLLLAAVLAVTVYETGQAFAQQSLNSTSRDLAAEIADYQAAVAGQPASSLDTFSVRYLSTQVLPTGEEIMLELPGTGRLGSAGSGPLLDRVPVARALDHPPDRTTSTQVDTGGTSLLVTATPIRQGGSTVGSLVVVADLATVHADQRKVLFVLAGNALVALVAAVAGAYLLLRRLLRTIGRMTATAAAVTTGEVDQRLGDPGTDDEVGQLAATFDLMLDRLGTAMAAQRRLLSDVSHQLRTPLTVARGHLEVMDRVGVTDEEELHDTVQTVVDELDHMRALVERLLLLGRSLEPDFLETHPLDLRAFAADLVEAAQVLGVRHWRLSDVPDVVVDVDADKLRGAMLNLLDNAVRATTDSDTVAVDVRRGTDGSVVLAVEDSGPGIPPEPDAPRRGPDSGAREPPTARAAGWAWPS